MRGRIGHEGVYGTLNVQLLPSVARFVVVDASADTEFDSIFSSLAESKVGGVVVENDPFFDSRREPNISSRVAEVARPKADPTATAFCGALWPDQAHAPRCARPGASSLPRRGVKTSAA
jgi:hypothetical protein